MNAYLLVKYLHILSATLLFGTGLGTAFYLFVVNRGGNVQAIASVSRWVVIADTLFTTPTVFAQPWTGLWMAQQAGWGWQTPWVLASLGLFLLAGICWLPVVWLQIRMRDMAAAAVRLETPLPPLYWRYERCWIWLGVPAFAGLLAVYWLMVAKPG